MVPLLLLHMLLLLFAKAVSAGLRDPPISGASNELLYLDGKGWTATGLLRTFSAGTECFNGTAAGDRGGAPAWATNAGGLCGQCNFAEDTDFGEPGSGVLAEKMGAELTPQQCCEVCGADAFCAAAVWHVGHNKWTGAPLGQCILKSAGDVARKASRANYTAIVPAARSAWQTVSIAATVPGDLVTDLQRAGIIDDPLFGTNFKNASVWNGPVWNYSTTFDHPAFDSDSHDDGAAPSQRVLLLVFDGIKMGAKIWLNGHFLGNASDQHRRYVFPVSAALRPVANQLTVSFDSSVDMSAGRFMGCSGGWDWAPYSNARDHDSGLPVFTKGVWKSVYLVPLNSNSAAITSLVPLVKYTGADWPIKPMADDGSAPFVVDARVFLRAEQPVSGDLTVTGSWGGSATARVSISGGGATTQINVSVVANGPKLWWARGMGRRSTMYNVTATFVPASGFGNAAAAGQSVSASRRIGFRHLVLVTVNDTDPAEVAAVRSLEGNGNHTLMLRLNGAPTVGLGANMVPMEIMEGRYSAGMHRQIVQSAADGGMSLLRVWGGGIYPYEEWFNACDELGVLSIVDMMYGTDGSGKAPDQPDPQATAEQAAEFRDNVRRMSHHPSVAMYTGCNECMGLGMQILNDFVLKTVASEDDSRPIRDASPFTGYCTGVDRLTGFPNGRNLTTQYWPSCRAPPPPPAPCPAIKTRSQCDLERCTWNSTASSSGHCENPPPPAPSADCLFEPGIDYQGSAAGVASASPQACCALCKRSASCAVGVWVGPPGHCYLKANASSGYPRPGGGRYSCKPNKTVSSPAGPEPASASALAAVQPNSDRRPLHHGEEVHGPYDGGGGWPSINGLGHGSEMETGPRLMYGVPTDLRGVGSVSTGGYMRTETGYGSMSSFESMSATLPPEQWGVEAESMHERNYPCHTHIRSYFGPNISLSGVGTAPFQKQLYLCMLAQGFHSKAAIEAWRSSNVWGLLMWQLNEIWPTGGWGSLEYGTAAAKGQVTGGRWKILHNLMRQSSFADVFVGCGIATSAPEASIQTADNRTIGKASPLCYLRNDTPDRFIGVVTVTMIALQTGKVTPLATIPASVAGLGTDGEEGSAQLFCPNGKALLGSTVPSGTSTECGTFASLMQSSAPACDPTSCYLDVRVEPSSSSSSDSDSADSAAVDKTNGVLLGHNELLLAAPSQLKLPPIELKVELAAAQASPEDGSVAVTVAAESGGVAAYVWLSTLAAGRFEPNGFMMGANGAKKIEVRFIPFGQQPVDLPTLRASVRVEHLGGHLS